MLQWQKQHQNDLKMLAAKEEQLREFQEEMAALKENLLEDDKEVGMPQLLRASSPRLQAHPAATQMPDSLWWGWGSLGAKERSPPPFSTKQGPQLLVQPTRVLVTLLIDTEQNEGPILEKRLLGTPATPDLVHCVHPDTFGSPGPYSRMG